MLKLTVIGFETSEVIFTKVLLKLYFKYTFLIPAGL
nr:MAG TPA: hypothetical protein [Caudoviricetes sp.]